MVDRLYPLSFTLYPFNPRRVRVFVARGRESEKCRGPEPEDHRDRGSDKTSLKDKGEGIKDKTRKTVVRGRAERQGMKAEC